MMTLLDCKQDRQLQRISGYCPDSADFIDLVNSSVRRALRRGDFMGTVVPIYLCVRSGCVTWPRYVQNVRALSWCGHNIQPKNMWGDFLPRESHHCWRQGISWCCGGQCQSAMVDGGRTSVFQDIQGEGRLIRAYARCNDDYGKTLTFFGQDNNGQDLLTVLPDGTRVPGIILTLGAPFASSAVFVRHIDYVLKDETVCPVNVFAYWAAENVLEDIAQYDPGETRPSYQRTKLRMPWAMFGSCAPSSNTCCDTNRGVAALVKLAFIPARFDTDLVIIDNIEALKLLFQSCKFGEAGDRQNSKLFEADAIAELNRDLENNYPDEQFVADNQIFGGHTFTNHCY